MLTGLGQDALPSAAEEVRRYYDLNTRRFLRYGQGGATGAIHRALWGPGVRTREEAFHYVHRLVAERLGALAGEGEPHVVDLGCGVGASLGFLARDQALRGTAVTLSPLQAELAAQRFAHAGLSARVRVLCADFCALPPELERADFAFAIEAFLHGYDAPRFFAECARLLRPGGRLVLCDDVLGARAGEPGARPWLARFRRGWHANTLLTPSRMEELAREAGFAERERLDLTPYLELGRPRDLGIAALMRAFGWLPLTAPYWGNLLGGHALQVGLARGYLAHVLLAYERLP